MGAFLNGKQVGAGAGGMVEQRRAQLDLTQAVLQQLASLAGHQRGQIIGVVAQGLGDFGQIGCPFGMGDAAPL